MIELICENTTTKQQINLTYNSFFKISHFEGLDLPDSDIMTTTTPYMAGSIHQKSTVLSRQIIINCVVTTNRIDLLKRNLYSIFKAGQKGLLYLNGSSKSGKIEYYLEGLKINDFELPVTMQIVLKAPYPYFDGLNEILQELVSIEGLFYFETEFPEEGIEFGEITEEVFVTFNNDGDIDTGLICQFVAIGQVVNPSVYNALTNEFIGVNITLEAGETLVINTNIRNKSIKLLSSNQSRNENQINNIMTGSKWIQVRYGLNTFSYEADSGKELCRVSLRYKNEYEAMY